MVILNQSKDYLVTEYIDIWCDGGTIHVRPIGDIDSIVLGTYASKERAQAILQAMFQLMGNEAPIFKMPKE